MSIENLVPPLDLCKKIPAGEFNYTAFSWYAELQHINRKPPHEYSYYVADSKKDNLAWGGYKAYPAPTLEEIIRKIRLDLLCGIEHHGDFYVANRHIGCFEDERAAAAALRLWLKLKGY